MLKLKQTTIIALDPHSAAFCNAARSRLESSYGSGGRLIQVHALKAEEGNGLQFVEPEVIADASFDLHVAREKRVTKGLQTKSIFEHSVSDLENALSLMLRSGRSAIEMEAAQREGISILKERVLYLVLSSADSFAGEVVLDLLRLIRWLFDKRLTGEPYTLHLLVLLPDLFVGHGPPDYVTTYGLLKRLDHAASMKIRSSKHEVQPFDTCWLMDGRNARAVEIGTLEKNLASYVDAFSGFLTAEPERSGALPGTLTQRGKVAAYNSFGYGELFFPTEITLTRLSSALASDIIQSAFLGAGNTPSDNRRKLLLGVKQFVLSKDFENRFAGLEQKEGATIWQNFRPKVEFTEEAPQEYMAELQLRHKEFDRESLLAFRNALLARKEEVGQELAKLLDDEVDRRADANPRGLGEALDFLQLLTAGDIALEADLLGERPQNLLTEHSTIKASLDGRLGVTVDRATTNDLLDEIHDIRVQLTTLQTNLRLTSSIESNRNGADHPAEVTRPERSDVETETVLQGTTEKEIFTSATEQLARAALDQRRSLVEEIAEAQALLSSRCDTYRRAVDEEDRGANQLRREGRRNVRDAKAAMVGSAEEQLLSLSDQLRLAKQTLEELRQDRRAFLRRYLLFIPFVTATIIFGLPLLLALVDFGPARDLISVFVRNLESSLFYLLILAAIYVAAVLWKYWTGINRQFKDQEERVKFLKGSVEAAAVQLLRARNDQLRLDYEIFAADIRAETIANLIEYARRSAEELRSTLAGLREAQVKFEQERDEASPQASIMRRPAVSAEELDDYYRKNLPDVAPDAEAFTREVVSRAQSRRLSPDDFRRKLTEFSRNRFDRLATLSLGDVLNEADLVTANQSEHRLRELSDISEPLLNLRELDANDPNFAQRDTTLWVGAEDRDRILKRFQSLKSHDKATAHTHQDSTTVRVLTRCLNFPAHFIGPIEYYRACYERATDREADDLPDLLPVDIEMTRAFEQLLLGLAYGLITKRDNGEYILIGQPERPLGTDRRQIAEKLAGDFTFQDLYDELRSEIERVISDQQVFEKIAEWQARSKDLDSFEHEILENLLKKYHPLR